MPENKSQRPAALLYLALVAILLLPACAEKDIDLVGTVERTAYELAAPTSEVIIDMPVAIGEPVRAGDVVVQLDTTVAQAELQAFEAGLSAAQAGLSAAEREFKRIEGLRVKKAVSANQVDRARSERDEALAAVAEKRARILQTKKHLEDLTIRPYADGVLDQLPFQIGERVPGGVVVAVVQADEKPWIRIWVPARVVARLAPGSNTQVWLPGHKRVFTGKVTSISREPEFTPHYALTERESAHLVYRAKVVLEDAPVDLRPGLAARIKLHLKPLS